MVKRLHNSKPIFVINPKNEMYGDDLFELALIADNASRRYDVQVIITCNPFDVYRISRGVKNLFIFGQHIDPIKSGPTTGKILPEALYASGAVGTMINHPENQILFSDVQQSITRAHESNLISLTFAQTLEQAIAITHMGAKMIVIEKPEFIASNTILDSSYMKKVTVAVHTVRSSILVLQGAGIQSGKDVGDVLEGGVAGTGSSSGIFKAENPQRMVVEMISGARRGWDKKKGLNSISH